MTKKQTDQIKKINCLECTCSRCGHVWVTRKPEPPKVCPNAKCHSPNWQKPKIIKRVTK